MVYCILYGYSIKYNTNMNIRIHKINKIKLFWIIVLIILGLGYIYFYKYNQMVNEGFLNNIKHKLARGTRQKMEIVKNQKDTFINQLQNGLIKTTL